MLEKGVIIEFDFAAMDGAELLFMTAKNFLAKLDRIALDIPTEVRHLLGNTYLTGLASLFSVVKTKKTSQKAAKDISAAFSAALTEAVPSAVTPAFRNFVTTLSSKGVKVVIATRADVDAVRPAFEPVLGDNVMLFREESPCYGAVKWDSWRRICVMTGMSRPATIAVAGSGISVKSALLAGIGAVAVVNDRVAYQDFTGANAILSELSGTTARKVLSALRME